MRAFEDEIFSKFVRTPTSDDLVDIFCSVSIQQLQLQYYHFLLFKTQFIRDAHAYTVAPDNWKVLLSQHRCWINSTVHNLGELVFLEQLCGFCCFSMCFVVMIDLLSTLIQPVVGDPKTRADNIWKCYNMTGRAQEGEEENYE